MSQSGYTPILIYGSGTASNVPLAANLTSTSSGAELALNYADGKLYYKNSSGVVTLLASSSATGGTFTNLTVTGVADFADGTAALPSITNTGDTNTGIFFPAADTVGVSTGGSERMRIDSSGNVGVGVTPSAWATVTPVLQINTAAIYGYNNKVSVSANYYFSTVSKYIQTGYATQYEQDSGKHVWYNAPSGTAGGTITFTQAMTLDASGRLAIGYTGTPPAKLYVSGTGWVDNGSDSANVFYVNAGGEPSLRLGQIGNISYVSAATSGGQSTSLAFQTAVGATVTERMRITSAGDVGIGTTSPARKFVVSGSADPTVVQITNTTSGVGVDDGFQIIHYASGETQLLNRENNATAFYTNNTERMRIDSSGNVGIGTSSPSSKLYTQLSSATAYSSGVTGNGLTIYNSSATTNQYVGITLQGEPTTGNGGLATIMGTTTGSGNMDLTFSTRGSATLAERMRIDSSGNVGIGTSSPGSILDIVSSAGPTLTLRSSAGAYTSILKLQAAAGGGSVINATGATSDALIFQITSSEKARIDASGNLLVGDTTYRLSGLAAAGQAIQLGSRTFIGSNASGDTSLGGLSGSNFTAIYSNGAEKARLDSSGFLGLNKTPARLLDMTAATAVSYMVSSTGTNTSYYAASNTGGAIYVGRENSVGGTFGTTAYAGVLWSEGAYPLVFATNNTERMRIDSSGNLIVGNTTAYGIINGYTAQGGTQLSVLHGSAGSYPKVSGISFGQPSTSITVSNNGGTTTFTGGAGIYANNTASSGNPTSLVFWTNSSGTPAEAMRIDSAGNAQFSIGAVMPYAPAPAAISAAATLTNAYFQGQIISATGTTYTITMPLGTTLETLATWATTNVAYDFFVINTASGTVTMAVNTGVTSLGTLTIATGVSAQFRIRRTAANTFVLYRLG